MTEERQNELWAFLTPIEKKSMRRSYRAKCDSEDFNDGYDGALRSIFGEYNLTSESDETTQKIPSQCENEPKCSVSEPETTQKSPSEPKFKVGDCVMVIRRCPDMGRTGLVESYDEGSQCYTVGKRFFRESDLMLRSELCVTGYSNSPDCTENGISDYNKGFETAKSVETGVNYAQFRLDLAKELAVAKMNRNGCIDCDEIVDDATEITRQLKETDNAD